MRILIYGAGVIGSLYAALFAEAGYDTTIYARGKRLEALRNNGLQYKKNQEVIKAEVRIFGELPNDDIYDFVLLTVREHIRILQISEACRKAGKSANEEGQNYLIWSCRKENK